MEIKTGKCKEGKEQRTCGGMLGSWLGLEYLEKSLQKRSQVSREMEDVMSVMTGEEDVPVEGNRKYKGHMEKGMLMWLDREASGLAGGWACGEAGHCGRKSRPPHSGQEKRERKRDTDKEREGLGTRYSLQDQAPPPL